MTTLRRAIAITELTLIFLAALFMIALFMRSAFHPANAAEAIVTWYSGRMWTLWVLLLTLPFAVLVIGCSTLLRSWRDYDAFRRAAGQTLALPARHRHRRKMTDSAERSQVVSIPYPGYSYQPPRRTRAAMIERMSLVRPSRVSVLGLRSSSSQLPSRGSLGRRQPFRQRQVQSGGLIPGVGVTSTDAMLGTSFSTVTDGQARLVSEVAGFAT